MDIKKNITLEERIQFVDFVCDMCERDGKLYYALFDYAWRVAVIVFFAPDAGLENMDADEMAEYVYSQQGIEIVEHPDIAVVTAGLYEACEAEMKDRREKNMRENHPDPLDRIADAFAEVSDSLAKLGDKDFLIEMVKEMQKDGKPREPIKQPVKIAVVNGGKEK